MLHKQSMSHKKQQKRTDENVKFEKNRWKSVNFVKHTQKGTHRTRPHLLFFLLQQGDTIRQELRIQFGLGGIPSYGLVNGDPYLTGL